MHFIHSNELHTLVNDMVSFLTLEKDVVVVFFLGICVVKSLINYTQVTPISKLDQ